MKVLFGSIGLALLGVPLVACGSRSDLLGGDGDSVTLAPTGGASAGGGPGSGGNPGTGNPATGGQSNGGTGGADGFSCAGLGQVDCIRAFPQCVPRYDQLECECGPCPTDHLPAADYRGCVDAGPACANQYVADGGCQFTPDWACEGALPVRCDANPKGMSAGCVPTLLEGMKTSLASLSAGSCDFAWGRLMTPPELSCPAGWVPEGPGKSPGSSTGRCLEETQCFGASSPECRSQDDCGALDIEGGECALCWGGQCRSGPCECVPPDARQDDPLRTGGLILGYAFDGRSCRLILAPCEGADCNDLPNQTECEELANRCLSLDR